ncbi:hypothetical protein NB689_000236 [Xanthomonas sacchari]|nr:hypothetical protein [Xanthomonas sacchari]MCW0414482.1 hypothetical protein [Xanthomonas sacchari]
MNLHQHARLSPRGRALLVDRILVHGLRVEAAAHAAGVSVRTASKWLRRFKEEGTAGLMDRSSRPRHCPHAIAQSIVDQLLEQRRCRQTYRQIAGQLPVAPSTIARLLRRAGLHRLAELEPALPDNRYEYAQPGQLLHLDIKKLARFRQPGHRVTDDRTVTSRGIGWEYVHLAIDDHSRVAFGTIEPDERGLSACRALMQAVRYYRSLGVRLERVDRQRRLLHITPLPTPCPTARPAPSANPPLHATHQWQGRAAGADQPARVGLCALLYRLHATRQRLLGLAASLQLASTTRQPRLQAAHLPNSTEQRGGFTHLAARQDIGSAAGRSAPASRLSQWHFQRKAPLARAPRPSIAGRPQRSSRCMYSAISRGRSSARQTCALAAAPGASAVGISRV